MGHDTNDPSKPMKVNSRRYKYYAIVEEPLMSDQGYYYWTRSEIEYLEKHYPNPRIIAEEIAEKLGRTRNAIFKMAARLGLKKEELRWE